MEGLGIAIHPNSWLMLSRRNRNGSYPYACFRLRSIGGFPDDKEKGEVRTALRISEVLTVGLTTFNNINDKRT